MTPRRALLVLALLVAAAVGLAARAVLTGADASRWPAPRAALATARKPRAALVLGMGPAPGTPLLDRTDLAADVFYEGLLEVVVASGGRGDDEPEAEAATIAQALDTRGVPEAAILIEDASRNTVENVERSLALLKTEGVVIGTLVIVTHDYHAARAQAIARALAPGVDVIAVGSDGRRLDRRPSRTARETLATIKWWLTP